MLAKLGKWLRAAGYDTEIAAGAHDDSALLARARRADRYFLTCDQRLVKEREPGVTDDVLILLPSSDPEVAAPALTRRLGIDWLYRPFSRCMEDNTPLRPATAEETARVPAGARAFDDPLMTCPTCGRVYWPGSHHRRMKRQLESWQAARD